jgi:23S rRNA pseudouridine1911/1915/1917 synthase
VRAIQKSDAGVVRAALGRHTKDRKLMAISQRGKMAVTHWKVVERFSYGTLLECKLETGRTHQIRVHMTSIGSPVVGDLSYGDFSNLPATLRDAARDFGRQALHAKSLCFTHPITREQMSFVAPTPSDMVKLIALFRG